MCGFSNMMALVGGYLWPSGRKYPPAKPLQNIWDWGNFAGICSYFQEKWPSFGQPDICHHLRAGFVVRTCASDSCAASRFDRDTFESIRFDTARVTTRQTTGMRTVRFLHAAGRRLSCDAVAMAMPSRSFHAILAQCPKSHKELTSHSIMPWELMCRIGACMW